MAAQVSDSGEALLATMVVTTLAFVQLARALASRSFSEPIWRTGLRGNPVLVGMLAAALALQLAVVGLPLAQEIFGTTALTAAQLAVGAGLALAILVLMEIDKAPRGRSTPRAPERRQLGADLA
jgi:P-type Ca2+ transporter type 2C